ncbi:hypothetical protein [Arthrobacter sp. MA-N2]|uniref:hypothetical protein n=1 Tax=Arthrobacter sp. MA-N2 TaxID=1101188 RepID=UPI0012DD9291|nr:hypothetical protein [Arthrobacter sp. MA-N2]
MRRSRSTADAGRTPALGRLAAVLAAAAVLIFAPGIAQAAFKSSTGGQTSVGTMAMAAPTGASVTASCSGRTLIIYVNSYGTVPRATSYEFTVADPNGTAVTPYSGTFYYQLSAPTGTWAYQIRGLYQVSASNIWKGQPYKGTVTC